MRITEKQETIYTKNEGFFCSLLEFFLVCCHYKDTFCQFSMDDFSATSFINRSMELFIVGFYSLIGSVRRGFSSFRAVVLIADVYP